MLFHAPAGKKRRDAWAAVINGTLKAVIQVVNQVCTCGRGVDHIHAADCRVTTLVPLIQEYENIISYLEEKMNTIGEDEPYPPAEGKIVTLGDTEQPSSPPKNDPPQTSTPTDDLRGRIKRWGK